MLPPLGNCWIIIVIWLYIALNRTPNIDCYWGGQYPTSMKLDLPLTAGTARHLTVSSAPRRKELRLIIPHIPWWKLPKPRVPQKPRNNTGLGFRVRAPSNPSITRVPFCLLFSFNKETPKKKEKCVLLGYLETQCSEPCLHSNPASSSSRS